MLTYNFWLIRETHKNMMFFHTFWIGHARCDKVRRSPISWYDRDHWQCSCASMREWKRNMKIPRMVFLVEWHFGCARFTLQHWNRAGTIIYSMVRSVNVTVPWPNRATSYNRARTTSRCRASTVARLEKSCLRSPSPFHRYGTGVSEPFVLFSSLETPLTCRKECSTLQK